MRAWVSAGPKKRRFAAEAVEAHVLANLGRCPEDIAAEIVRRVAERVWSPPVELARGVGIVASNLVRHRLTDYEQMLEVKGLSREEARLVVSDEVDDILASWKSH